MRALPRRPSAIRAIALGWRILHQPRPLRALPTAVQNARTWLESAEGKNFVYDLQTIAVMARVLGPVSSCVDVGSFEGQLLAHMVARAPRGRHYAVEPLPDKAAELRRRFPQVRVVQAALGDASGQAEFQYVATNPAYSGLRKRRYDRPVESVQAITVEVRRLDDVIPPDLAVRFIKIDVEGGELQVLAGARRTIIRHRPFVVFEHGLGAADVYGTRPEHVYDLLVGECGLRVSLMSSWLAGKPPLERHDFVSRFDDGRDFYYLACP